MCVFIQKKKKLLQLKDPETGEPVGDAVHQGEALYQGPHRERAPDLVVEWADYAYMPTESATSGDEVFVPRMREYMTWATTGSHRPEGVFIAAGPGIEKGTLSKSVRLLDLAPTWLAAMGAEPPSSFQGEVARDILRVEKAVRSVSHMRVNGSSSKGVIFFSIFDWWYHSHGHSDFQLALAMAESQDVLFVNSRSDGLDLIE